MAFVSHLECPRCKKTFERGHIYNLCACGSPLFVRYDLQRASGTLGSWKERVSVPGNLWRYRAVLPVESESPVCLGEGYTPLLHAEALGREIGLPNLYLKDESQNPTGSFKARGVSLAVNMARELGIKSVAMPSAGNAGGALAAYAAVSGMKVTVFMPESTPPANQIECSLLGAEVVLVPGTIKDCNRALRERHDAWFDMSTLREPYRVEGKKTMAYEVVEQLQGKPPDAIIYPTGGGTGLVGMWKAFGEMQELGWIGESRPRMFAVQSAGCAPIVRAFSREGENAEEWPDPKTIASGLRVPSTIADFLILRALRESRGGAVAVEEQAMLNGVRELAEKEGLIISPEGGATVAALKRLLADGFLSGHETVVLFLTASGYKYLEVLKEIAKPEKN